MLPPSHRSGVPFHAFSMDGCCEMHVSHACGPCSPPWPVSSLSRECAVFRPGAPLRRSWVCTVLCVPVSPVCFCGLYLSAWSSVKLWLDPDAAGSRSWLCSGMHECCAAAVDVWVWHCVGLDYFIHLVHNAVVGAWPQPQPIILKHAHT